jgi:hypothetical protein
LSIHDVEISDAINPFHITHCLSQIISSIGFCFFSVLLLVLSTTTGLLKWFTINRTRLFTTQHWCEINWTFSSNLTNKLQDKATKKKKKTNP